MKSLVILLVTLIPLFYFSLNFPKPSFRGLISDFDIPSKLIRSHINKYSSSLGALGEMTYLKIFKVDYLSPCPFWVSNYLCSLESGGSCGISCCDDDEVPELLKNQDIKIVKDINTQDETHWEDEETDMWLPYPDFDSMEYINLKLNPEKYTGYDGGNATRIWMAIYKENCFDLESTRQCFEKRLFFKLLSGFHASTNAHISENFQGSPNREFYNWRLGFFPERIENIYFAFSFIHLAMCEASPILLDRDLYHSGFPEEDEQVYNIMSDILSSPFCQSFGTFDKSLLFNSSETAALLPQMKQKFRNISRLIDCVTCESCKVHSKLQILGMGTAMKILFDNSYSLNRLEIVGLVNTLIKFSESVLIPEKMDNRALIEAWRNVILVILSALIISWYFFRDHGPKGDIDSTKKGK